jgi:hypothetical protein
MLDINLFKHDLPNLINISSDMIVCRALNEWHKEKRSTFMKITKVFFYSQIR